MYMRVVLWKYGFMFKAILFKQHIMVKYSSNIQQKAQKFINDYFCICISDVFQSNSFELFTKNNLPMTGVIVTDTWPQNLTTKHWMGIYDWNMYLTKMIFTRFYPSYMTIQWSEIKISSFVMTLYNKTSVP